MKTKTRIILENSVGEILDNGHYTKTINYGFVQGRMNKIKMKPKPAPERSE